MSDPAKPAPWAFKDDISAAKIKFNLPPGTRDRDLVYEVTPTTIKIGLKGHPPIVEGTLYDKIEITKDKFTNPSSRKLQVETGKFTQILKKTRKGIVWPTPIKGSSNPGEVIDPKLIDGQSLFILYYQQQEKNKEGLQWCLWSAEKNCREALLHIGIIFTETENSENFPEEIYGKLPNMEEGIKHLKKACQIWDSIEAALRLGEVYLREKNLPEAETWFLRVATAGHPPSQYTLAHIIEETLPKEKNRDIEREKSMVDWYRLAAEGGNTEALVRMGYFHLDGKYIPRDIKKALEYFTVANRLDATKKVMTEAEAHAYIKEKNQQKISSTQKIVKESSKEKTKKISQTDSRENNSDLFHVGVGLFLVATIALGFFLMKTYSRSYTSLK